MSEGEHSSNQPLPFTYALNGIKPLGTHSQDKTSKAHQDNDTRWEPNILHVFSFANALTTRVFRVPGGPSNGSCALWGYYTGTLVGEGTIGK